MSLHNRLTQRIRTLTQNGGDFARSRTTVATSSVHPPLTGHLGKGAEWHTQDGTCWTYSEDLAHSLPDGGELFARLKPSLEAPPSPHKREWSDAWAPARVVALDIETCGFTSAPLFMVGIAVAEAERLVFHQGFARDYSEEAALLEWTRERLVDIGLLVTFNGKSFDMPYVADRMRYYRAAPLPNHLHLDLLPICRRLWKGRFPNCRLQTFEEHLFDFVRWGDIPGAEIPDVYHTFVDTGNSRHVARVAEHNRLDIITLVRLYAEAWHAVRQKEVKTDT